MINGWWCAIGYYFVGDLGGSSQDGVGGDEASKYQAELPNSPSSSGGFCEFSSKGHLCREDMMWPHNIGGNYWFSLYKTCCLFHKRLCFQSVTRLWYWELSIDHQYTSRPCHSEYWLTSYLSCPSVAASKACGDKMKSIFSSRFVCFWPYLFNDLLTLSDFLQVVVLRRYTLHINIHIIKKFDNFLFHFWLLFPKLLRMYILVVVCCLD